jgi:hypothetical protein
VFEFCDEADEVGKIAPKPVEPPDDEGVSIAQALKAPFQLRPASGSARSMPPCFSRSSMT